MMPRSLAGLPGAALALFVALSSLPLPFHASLVCAPSGQKTVLRLQFATQPAVACDMQALERLSPREIVTTLPPALGMPGKSRWRGVSLRQLVALLGGNERHQIELTAMNDYSVRIPWSDLVEYDPILAYRRDQQPINIRDKGPLILIYPFDRHPRLQKQDYVNRTIWQVNALSVR
ncbi:molybdopterin-dependent oxidoreductase [Acidovorax sp.]|uniref:molybdopterin-dependent oxidoreductase n=1 Tax=Acidovorax sp. TaxID=1872122 RepID=UPI002ACD289B|nr:molybdopterin-dependent oxidoreductase [Acidovorax sp.]MDZ7862393.1 molybdopterin-dependent oxidoreductase [Acidovorax sp.]